MLSLVFQRTGRLRQVGGGCFEEFLKNSPEILWYEVSFCTNGRAFPDHIFASEAFVKGRQGGGAFCSALRVRPCRLLFS